MKSLHQLPAIGTMMILKTNMTSMPPSFACFLALKTIRLREVQKYAVEFLALYKYDGTNRGVHWYTTLPATLTSCLAFFLLSAFAHFPLLTVA